MIKTKLLKQVDPETESPSGSPLTRRIKRLFTPLSSQQTGLAYGHSFPCVLPSLNPHKARVRRNHGRLRSNGLIERAQSTLPNFACSRKCASSSDSIKLAKTSQTAQFVGDPAC